MELPPRLKFQGVLQQGQAFKAQIGHDKYPRYYFVLNIDPEADIALVLSTSTLEFEEHRNCKGGDDVHINLLKQDYPEIPQDSLICCDRPKVYNKTLLEQLLKIQSYELLQPLPQTILKKILQGILKSPVVEGYIKKMVLGGGE
jgi:hypothetical protein